MALTSRVVSPVLVLVLAACAGEPLAWDEVEYPDRASSAPPTVEHPGLCRAAEARLGELRWRAGWLEASGGLAFVMSANGSGDWNQPVIADARGPRGQACERPVPAVFADSSNDFLHAAYFIEAPGAPGVYYVHSMAAARLEQQGAGMFERPWAITYGARPARASVASRGDTVAVAYEDPNSARGPILLALSGTAGHSFDRFTSVPASAGGLSPTVELHAGELVVTWEEGAEAGRLVRRRGRFR